MSWPTVTLAEVAEIEREGVAPDRIPDGTDYLGLEHIESGGVILKKETVAKGDIASTKFAFTSDHLLYGKLRPYLAKIALPDFDGVCSTDILPIRPGPRLDKRFLAFYLRQPSMVDYAASRATGANLPRLSPKGLAGFPIPLPSLDEQRRIAGILDQADALRRLRSRALDKLNTLAQAIFHEMFGEDASPTVELGKLCTVVRGSSPRPQGDPQFFGGPVPRLMIADITRDGMSVTPRIDSLTEEGAKKSRPMTAGSVVMAVSGAVGLPAILAVDACIHDGFVGFRDLNDRIDPHFLYQILEIQRDANKARGTGAIWTNLTTDQVKRFPIPVPEISRQRDFVSRLKTIEDKAEPMRLGLQRLDNLFSSLQCSAFRGEL
ncbi:restriction endonuclease subunit S [Ferrovibrio sp.]|uniref:restriction endonuclease subunit S n=1 Tax=Ferrovibrio sp. TaxID=1917215 RepID=UPI003D0BFF62